MDMREAVSPDKLPPPLELTGIGNAHIRITATPEAQMWFDQGLNLFHDFWDYESVRAFEQGVRVDPQCAMCYWGIYRALKTNYRRPENKYYRDQALAKAVSLKDHASITERLYIEAGAPAEAAGKSAMKSKSTTESKELQLYRKLVKRNPKDMQARIFWRGRSRMATTTTANRAPGKEKPWPFSKPFSKRTLTNQPRITTGFTWSRQVPTPRKPFTALKSSPALPQPQHT
jgi:hypothetical protein